jgi:hypothetical protein
VKNAPAFPIPGFSLAIGSGDSTYAGLTKRELISAMAMQGLLASPNSIPALEKVESNSPMQVRLSHASVFLADALIEQLEKAK